MSEATQVDYLVYRGSQPYAVRVLTSEAGTIVLVQCPRCERATMAPSVVEEGPEGISLAPRDPGFNGEIVCGYEDCRAPFVVWRGNMYVH